MNHLPFEWKMAYFFTFRARTGRDGFLSFISVLSALGIALGVAALIIILSVMNGFQKEVRDRMLSVISHLEIQNFELRQDFKNTNLDVNHLLDKPFSSQLLQQFNQAFSTFIAHNQNPKKNNSAINKIKSVQATKASFENQKFESAIIAKSQVMLVQDGQIQGVLLQGINPSQELHVSAFLKKQHVQALQSKSFAILIGQAMAQELNLSVGSQINLATSEQEIGPLGITPIIKTFAVVGIFSSGHYEYDRNLILAHIDDVLAFTPNAQTALKIKIEDLFAAPEVAKELNQAFKDANLPWHAIPWSEQNKTWFAAVKTEKTMMFIILTLIIAVAAFNLVSGLVMNVKDKQGQIAVLSTFGAQPSHILKIFMLQGLFIALLGLVIGVALGTSVAFNVSALVSGLESLLGVEFLPQQIYLISKMPSDPHWQDIALITGFSLFISLLATIYPSVRASRLKPAVVLRAE